MRLFLGVAADAPIASAAASLSRELQARAAQLAPRARVSWVPADRLHVTVLFIGRVDERGLDAIRHALLRPFAEPPFEVTVEGAGVFPGGGPPRVVWAGVTTGREAFIRVRSEAFARVSAVVPLEPEHEAWPHFTLARVKEAGGLRARALLDGFDHVRLGTQRLEAVTLFESRTAPNGVQYVPLHRTDLSRG